MRVSLQRAVLVAAAVMAGLVLSAQKCPHVSTGAASDMYIDHTPGR
ncbi:hypothetical protein [Paractinoplanes lichenicola]|uniref:Uncharacterized protein n=1 Tax=Paractinoplanes lichenicola TaxID=2802976 RepID=A0ABS1VTZ9_9ACTN|nr:hypothetical protein [Actinoplanes lichenicola]MBL7257951.1 hypothetical protein [Actinoplanes lichenicola]